ncbi:MAG: GatB/YqeY domain-containing protein [Candidatus Omnitrophota bacterium]|jgi:hypothetical protein
MLGEKILNGYKEALKSKDSLRSSVLSFLRAQILNLAIEKKKNALDDADIVLVIRKQIKQRQESIEQFTKGNRSDLAAKEALELEILKAYLPPELSLEEIKKIVDESIAAAAATGIKDMGRVMKDVVEKVAGKADGKLVSDLVKDTLTKKSL